MRTVRLALTVGVLLVFIPRAQAAPEAEVSAGEVQELQEQINMLQRKLDRLLKGTGDGSAAKASFEAGNSVSGSETSSTAQPSFRGNPSEGQERAATGSAERDSYLSSARVSTDPPSLPAVASASVPDPQQPAYPTAQAKESPALQALENRVTIGGYGSARFETNDVPDGNNFPGGSPSGFTFRRFVLTTDAQVTPRLRIYSETEFERLNEIEVEKSVRRSEGGLAFQQATEGNSGGEISIEQLWGQFQFASNHGLRFGVVLPPLGRFNIHHDDDYWDLPRRTLVDRDAPVLPNAAAWRELGAGLAGSFNLLRSWKLDYQFYVLNGTTLNFDQEVAVATRAGDTTELEVESEVGLASGAFDGSQGAHAVAWRTAFSPKIGTEFAFSGYHGRYTPSFLSVREPINSLGFDGNWRHGGFEAEGEFIYTSLGRVGRVLENLAAAGLASSSEAEIGDVETEVELAAVGLARTRYGFWTDFKYHWRPAFLKRSFFGRDFEDPQLIPIVRYERVWLNRNLNDLAFSDGQITALEQENLQQDRVSMGVNYRPVPQFGIQFAYEHNERRDGSRLIFPAVPEGSTNGFLFGMTFGF